MLNMASSAQRLYLPNPGEYLTCCLTIVPGVHGDLHETKTCMYKQFNGITIVQMNIKKSRWIWTRGKQYHCLNENSGITFFIHHINSAVNLELN